MNLTTKNACPVCSSEMDFNWETKEIPHFGEAMIIAGVCCCGYRHCDTILLSQKEPVRYTLTISSLEDLDVRVIRSSSGTIRVPELGIDVEPGPASEAYVSNVEGVLTRIRDIVEFAARSAPWETCPSIRRSSAPAPMAVWKTCAPRPGFSRAGSAHLLFD